MGTDALNTDDCLDMMILNSASPNSAVGFCRRNSDVWISEIAYDTKLRDLMDFTERIRQAVEPGATGRPSRAELQQFGNGLFNFCFFSSFEDLYKALPNSHIRMQFLSCHEDIKSVPWEFMQEPKKSPGPRLYRSIVRIVPFYPNEVTPQECAGQRLKVLFVASYPIDQDKVSWTDVARRVERSLRPYKAVELVKCIPGTWKAFREKVRTFKPDVVHFSGHGSVGKSGTQLLFMMPDSNKSEPVGTDRITAEVRDRGIRLVVLSACETSTNPRVLQKEYAVLAEVLVREGVRAVVANQLPVPDDTTATFVGPLYEKLLETGDIDVAVAEGRLALFSALENNSTGANLEWGIPTLHRRLGGARILKV